MGAIFPLPHIIFFLATLFLPPGTTKFSTTMDLGRPMTATWTQEADGWHAMSADGQDGGVWTVKGLTVLETRQEHTSTTDLGEFVKVKIAANGDKLAVVKGTPVEVSNAESTLTLSQESGALKTPIVITYSGGQELSAGAGSTKK